jgi:hypothetical protein
MDTPISLPRPRVKGSPIFVEIVEQILHHVMGKQESFQKVREARVTI